MHEHADPGEALEGGGRLTSENEAREREHQERKHTSKERKPRKERTGGSSIYFFDSRNCH